MNTQTDTGASLLDVPSAESTFRDVNGVTLHTVAAGDQSDPLVVLLHGFPEFWYEWREYVAPLVDAGYRVLVPDQRGYNRSDRPEGVRAYRITELSRDVLGLIESEDRESAHVLGHDWGAAVAWDLALRHPEAIDRLGIVNVPHPTVLDEVLRSNPRQMLRSWYILFFQLPRLPEWFVARDDYSFMIEAMAKEARPGAFDPADLDHYRRAWSREGALTAMINWYRAMARHRERPPRDRVAAPTLLAWGENDQALIRELGPLSAAHCEDVRFERFPEATHWVPHEYPDRLTDLFLSHLAG